MKNIAKTIVEEKLNCFEVVREFDYGFIVMGFIRLKKDAFLPTCKFHIFNDIQDRVTVQFLDTFTEEVLSQVFFDKKSFRELTDGNILFAALLKGFLTS